MGNRLIEEIFPIKITRSINVSSMRIQGKMLLFFSLVLLLSIRLSAQTTLYSYKSGSWNDVDTWTTDPGGTTLVGSQVPANGDIVVILSSRTVTLPTDITTTGLDITINSGGTLDQGPYRFSNTLTGLHGEGMLRLQSSNFPSATTNTFVEAGGGTADYYGFTGTLTQTEYNNLRILKTDNNATSYTLTLGSDVTIHGNFDITRVQGTGTVTVTLGNSVTVRTVSVAGNLTISSGGFLNTGNYAAIHILNLAGDLINNGSIDLSNAAQYASATALGAAITTFTGESDNNLMCNGPTDFYRIILNKGTDRTYILSVTSADASYFRLFGPVTATGGDWSTLPLILQNGTLRLRSAVNIPVLGKNTGTGTIREFHIPGSAGLWIDGATVSTSDDGGGWRGITVYGLLRISAGTFTNPNNTGGITYFGNIGQPGYIYIEGGTINTTQVKQADINGRVTYHQTGGTLRITGYSDSRNSSAVFALPTADFNYIMTGGNVYISGVNTTATNGIDIQVATSNFNVTGGTFMIVRPSASDDQSNFEISSTAPFYNLILKDTSAAGTNTGFQILSDLTVLNDLTVTNRTLDALNNDVTVGGDFTVGPGAVYTPGTNTTVFNGTGNQTFMFDGTISSGLNNLIINKSGGTITFFRNSPSALSILGTFDLIAGSLDDGGNTLNVYGNITNSGIHSGTGSIVLLDNDPQTIGGNGSGVFQNLNLNNTDALAAPVTLTAGITVNGTLSLTSNKIFSIGSYSLTLGESATIAGTFSASRFVQTSGDIGDKGITKYFSTNSFVFPLGVGTKYTPSSISFSTTPTTYGAVTVFPVDAEQMQTSPSGKNRSLTYFWRALSSGFTLGSATVTQKFYYDQTDVTTGGGITENEYSPARYNPATFIWNKGTAADVDETNNIINWPNNVTYIDGDYTAGDDNPAAQDPFGAVTVFYSSGAGTGAWNNRPSWVTDTVTMVNGPNSFPDENTPAVIRNGHTIRIDANNRRSGNLQIQASGVLDCLSYTGLNFGVVTNPVNGSGRIRISTNVFPAGDFTEFRGINGGTVEYYTPAGSSFTIPTTSSAPTNDPLTYYHHLMLTPATGRTITMPNINMMIYGNMTVQGAGSTYLNTTATRTLNITGDLLVVSGTLQFRTGQSQNIITQGSLSISSGAIYNLQNSGTTANSLTLYGDLINNGTLTFRYTPATSYCDITFAGSTNTSFTGTGNTTLRNLTLNKGTSQNTTLTVDVSGATFSTPVNNWLTLTNGTFRFMRTGDLNITTTGTFTIPTTAGLLINHSSAFVYLGNSNNDNNDVYLDGKLTLLNGTIYVGPSAAPLNNNDIEYSSSGNSALEIQNGTLVVNGQIRRSTTGTGGVLVYKQSGGDVTINGNNHTAIRAKLEIENAGSEFTMSGGTLAIVRGGGTTYGDLYLRPAGGSCTGGTIYFGTQNVGIQSLSMDASIALNNLTINGIGALNTVQLMVNPLILDGNLVINNAASVLACNNNNLTVRGNFTNNGTYTPGTNTTLFDGNAQTIDGTTATMFYNLYVDPSSTLTLTNNITVNNILTVNTGTFQTDTYDVNAKGNVIVNSVHSSDDNSGGILLNGTVEQQLSGLGIYGRLELNNSAGARTLNNITLSKDFLLTTGILNINQNLITLGVNSDIVGSGFSSSKMIMPDGVYSNVGISKYFSTGPASFTYPLGVSGKYTPAFLTIDDINTPGPIRVNVINAYHPTVSDPGNVLQYYWEVQSSGISGFEGNLTFNYINGDVLGIESDYVAARLVVPPGTDWSKAAPGSTTDNVDETANTVSFDFPAGTLSLGGEYTAGNDAAIPDNVPIYISNSDGNWDDVDIWTPQAPSGGPNGFIVVISTGDSVSTNGNRRFAYRTTINGILDIGTTYGHNLGNVEGTGKLYLESETLPAGRFNSFFSCTGGTLEYGGAADFILVADRIDSVRNLYFTGTGTKTLPNKDLVICNLLKIDQAALDNSLFNRKLTLLGAVQRINSGSFLSGTGANATLVFKGVALQQVGGPAGNFTSANALNNLEINNTSGLTLNGPLELKGNLLLTDGIINTTSVNLLSMINWNTSVVPDGGSLSSFVNGPISKRIFTGDDFSFPVGKGSRFGKMTLLGISNHDDWIAEYFNSGFSSTAVTVPLTAVSSNEYWHVIGPAGEQAYVKLRWDPLSDVTPLTTQNGLSDIRVAEYNTVSTSWVAQNTTALGDNYNGTAQTNNTMNLDEHDYTLGSISSLKPRAGFASTADACAGDNLTVVFTNTAASYSFTYSIDGGADQPITTASNPYTWATSTAGRYRLTGFAGGVVDTNSVLVRPVPTATLSSSDADDAICEGENVIFTASGGIHYNFQVNGATVQNGVSTTYTTSSLSDGDVVTVLVTNASGCTDVSPSIIMTVHPLPVPALTGNQITCTNGIELYTTDDDAGIMNYSWTVTGGTFTGGSTHEITVTWGLVTDQYDDNTVTVNYTDANGCTATVATELIVRVYKEPETGPAYYVPNTYQE